MNETFDVHDTILYPLTYENLVLMAQNINPASGRTLRGEFEALLKEKAEEALELFDEHEEDIYKEAFPDEYEKQEENPLGEEATAALAKDIYDFLIKYDMWIDVSIYFNGIRWSTHGGSKFRYGGEPFVAEADPRDYFEYVGPILSMGFEGPFYEVVNGYRGEIGWNIEAEFRKLLAKYGVYYELGNAWNLSVYKI